MTSIHRPMEVKWNGVNWYKWDTNDTTCSFWSDTWTYWFSWWNGSSGTDFPVWKSCCIMPTWHLNLLTDFKYLVTTWYQCSGGKRNICALFFGSKSLTQVRVYIRIIKPKTKLDLLANLFLVRGALLEHLCPLPWKWPFWSSLCQFASAWNCDRTKQPAEAPKNQRHWLRIQFHRFRWSNLPKLWPPEWMWWSVPFVW